MGRAACEAATGGPVAEGNVGAGTGATVGKLFGMDRAMKGGLGTASLDAGGGLIVGALAAVNALGDVRDPESGRLLAGARLPGESGFADTARRILSGQTAPGFAAAQNTTLVVVAANALLTKEEAVRAAESAHDGLARTISPAHTLYDGDTVFTLATGAVKADILRVEAAAAEAAARAILRAVLTAESAGGLPAAGDMPGGAGL